MCHARVRMEHPPSSTATTAPVPLVKRRRRQADPVASEPAGDAVPAVDHPVPPDDDGQHELDDQIRKELLLLQDAADTFRAYQLRKTRTLARSLRAVSGDRDEFLNTSPSIAPSIRRAKPRSPPFLSPAASDDDAAAAVRHPRRLH